MRRIWPLYITLPVVILCATVSSLCSTLTIVPLLLPSPSTRDTLPAQDLAYPESRFVEVMGVEVHYVEAGVGDTVFLLLHGFGASTYSWQGMMEPLSRYGRVIAYDRPGFGLTERPRAGEYDAARNPYAAGTQPDLVVALMDAIGVERAVLVGHSAGGSVAVATALRYPERVRALILESPAVIEAGGPVPSWLRPIIRSPQSRRLGPWLARLFAGRADSFLETAWEHPEAITAEMREGYQRPFRVEGWDRGLWEVVMASGADDLRASLGDIRAPAVVITGDGDRIVPPENSRQVAEAIPGVRYLEVPDCGHIAHEERPAEFLAHVDEFLQEVGLAAP